MWKRALLRIPAGQQVEPGIVLGELVGFMVTLQQVAHQEPNSMFLSADLSAVYHSFSTEPLLTQTVAAEVTGNF